MSRRLVAGAVLVALGTLPAAAHVVLTRAEVPAEADVDLAMRAPIEREGTTNRKLYALIPGPFVVTSCQVPSVAWSCSLDTATRPGSTFITWETPVAGSPQDLRFEFKVRTPNSRDSGEYKFPVVQTYSDGHVARWIQDGEPSPAPRLRVVPKGQPVSTAEPTPPPDATSPPAAPGASRSGSPRASRSAGASPSRSATAATTASAAPAAVASAAESAAPEDTAGADSSADSGGGVDVATDLESGDQGRSAAPVAVAAIAAVLAAAGGALAVRRRRVSGPSTGE
ncbi:MAG TPA: DUF1775 domain-containing protein [Mycobacteriales bacterium]|nr:DUF1775 domain-containing protein [Mycobacteriales bacterium]